jgi:tetratricopeptide (TPR) repeat protein
MKEDKTLHSVAVTLLSLFSIALYLNSLNNSFLFDDAPNIIENPYIRNLGDIPLFLKGLGVYTSWYRALPALSFAINYHFHKLDVFGYHLVNLVLHILSGIFIYFISRNLFNLGLQGVENSSEVKNKPRLKGRGLSAVERVNLLSLLTAAIFISHPIQVNTVTYIVGRNEGMASLFYLISFFLFIKMSLSRGLLVKGVYFLGVMIFFFFAILSKEIGFTLPVILILFDLMFVCENWETVKQRLKIYTSIGFFLILFLLFFLREGIFTILFRQTYSWTPWENLLTQTNVIIQYFKLLFLPLPNWLNVDHDFQVSKSLFAFPTWISVSIILLLLILAIFLIKKNRLISFLIAWFFIVLAPTSSLIPIWDIMVEYRLYLPLFSYALLLTLGLHYLYNLLAHHSSRKIGQRVVWGAAILILCFYSLITIERNGIFKDDFTLWSDAVKKSPNKMRVHHNLGRAYFNRGDIDGAIREGEIALKLSANLDRKENVKFVLNLLGGSYFLRGEVDRALNMFNRAIEVDPNFATSYYNVSCIHATRKEKDKALEYLKRAISLDQNYRDKAKRDKDFDYLRGEKEFEEMVK